MLYSKYKGHPCVTEALLFTCYCRKKTPKTDILTVSPPLFRVLRGPAQPWLNRWSGSSRGAGLRRQVNGALACVSAIKTWETVSVQTWTIQYAVIQNTMKFTVNLIISAECWTFTISCHVICPVSWSVPCVCVCAGCFALCCLPVFTCKVTSAVGACPCLPLLDCIGCVPPASLAMRASVRQRYGIKVKRPSIHPLFTTYSST